MKRVQKGWSVDYEHLRDPRKRPTRRRDLGGSKSVRNDFGVGLGTSPSLHSPSGGDKRPVQNER